MALPQVSSEMSQLILILRDMGRQSELAKRAAERLAPDLWQALREVIAMPEIQGWLKSEEGLQAIKDLVADITPGVMSFSKAPNSSSSPSWDS